MVSFKALYSVSWLASFVPFVKALASTDSIQDADSLQSGYLPNHNISPALISDPSFGQLWATTTIAGEQFYAKPLVYTPSYSNRQLVISVSELNNVYVLDANNGTILYSRNVQQAFYVSDLNGGCNDISVSVGVTGTPVIDPTTDTLYFFSKGYKTNPTTGAPITGVTNSVYKFFAIDIHTLLDRPGYPVLIDGHVADNDPAKYFIGGAHHQRTALHLMNGFVYGGFASHCDMFNYTGWVIGVSASTGQVATMFSTEVGPSARAQATDGTWNGGGGGSGIWQGGFGLSSDGNGRLFFVTGNGAGQQDGNFQVAGKTPPGTLEMSVVNMKVDPSTGKATPQDFFQPYEYLLLDQADKDFGSGGFALLDPGTFAGGVATRLGVAVGKNGKSYILNADSLGGYRMGSGSAPDANIQTITTPNGAATFGGIGSYPGSKAEGAYIYMAPVGGPISTYQFGLDSKGNPLFTYVAATTELSTGRVGIGAPTITSNKGAAGSAILWVTDPDFGIRAWYAVPNGNTMTRLHFNGDGTASFGINKFQRPAFGDGKFYLSSSTGKIYCYGSPVALPLTCTPQPLDFGTQPLGTATSLNITCVANIPITSVVGVALSATKYFTVSNSTLPTGSIAVGKSFNITVTMDSTALANNTSIAPGAQGAALNVYTNNGVTGFSTSLPLSVSGTTVSSLAYLQLNPIEVSFGGIVVGSNESSSSSAMFISNIGQSSLTITGYAYELVNATSIIPIDETDYINGTYFINEGFAAQLPNVGTSLAGGQSISVALEFQPAEVGDYAVILYVNTTIGAKPIILSGLASTNPIALLEMDSGEGGAWVSGVTSINFGTLYGGQTVFHKMRLTNEGGSPLEVTKSKPPVTTELFATNPDDDFHESQFVAPGASAIATVEFAPLPRTVLNALPVSYDVLWTLNVDDLTWGLHEIHMLGTVITPQVGPLMSNGTGLYRYMGCFQDSQASRLLIKSFVNATLDNGACQTTCYNNGYAFAMTEFQTECWCGNTVPSSSLIVADTKCNYLCPAANSTQSCGGVGGFGNMWYDASRYNPATGTVSQVTNPTAPKIIQSIQNYNYIGCYSDSTASRTLSAKTVVGSTMNITTCANACSGYQFFGVEYGSECYCGNSLGGTTSKVSDDQCSIMFCPNDQYTYCGAGSRMVTYQLNGTAPAVLPSSTATTALTAVTSGTATSNAAATTSATTTASPAATPTLAGYSYLGCYSDTTANRTFKATFVYSSKMTYSYCASFCSKYLYFGVEYGDECYCDNTIGGPSSLQTSGCNMACAYDGSNFCGGSNRMNVFMVNSTASTSTSSTTTSSSSSTSSSTTLSTISTVTPIISSTTTSSSASTTSSTTSLSATTSSSTTTSSTSTSTSSSASSTPTVAGWQYVGCYSDIVANRTLKVVMNGGTMNYAICASRCSAYKYFGVEYGAECYCDNGIGGIGLPQTSGCNMPCSGDATSMCGGSNRLNLFMVAPAVTTTSSSTTSTSASSSSSSSSSSLSSSSSSTSLLASVSSSSTFTSSSSSASSSSTSASSSSSSSSASTTSSSVSTSSSSSSSTSASTTSSSSSSSSTSSSSISASSTSTLATSTSSSSTSTSNSLTTSTTSSSSISSTSGTSTTPTSSSSSSSSSSTSVSSTSTSSSTSVSSTSTTTSSTSSSLSTTSSSTSSTPTTTSSSTVSSSTSSSSTSTSSTAVPTVSWSAMGCAADSSASRLINLKATTSATMTIQMCQAFCDSYNYPLAGLEYSTQCYCGSTIPTGTNLNLAGCTMACGGAPGTTCGGSSRIQLYSNTLWKATAEKPNVNSFVSQGCYLDTGGIRALAKYSYTDTKYMSAETCVGNCTLKGYTMAGMEAGNECYCANSFTSGTNPAAASDCASPCVGNYKELCGGSKRLTVYQNTTMTR